MRLDHTLYLAAAIAFIIAGVLLSYQMAYREIWAASTAVLGFLFIGLGYSQKSKSQIKSKTVEASASLSQTLTISSSIEVQQKTSTANPRLTDIKGIGKKRAEMLRSMGITTIENLAEASAEDIATKLRVSVKTANTWIESAKKLVENPNR